MKYLLILILSIGQLFAEDSNSEVPNIAVLMPQGEQFQKVFQGIKDELDEDYNTIKVELNTKDIIANVKKLESIKPSLIVLMENRSIPVIAKYQENPVNQVTPILAAMILNVKSETKELKNIGGIKFEIPAYTIFSNIRILSESQFKTIGVFYNKDFQEFIDLSRKMVEKEKMELKAYCVDCEGDLSDSKVAKYMSKVFKKQMLKKDDVDVLWMLPDNRLLNAKTLKSFWTKHPKKKKTPLVVPIENLVTPKADLGMIMFNRDYEELGTQAASKVQEILEDEVPMEEVGFEELLSVSPILNKKRAKRIKWKLKEDKLSGLKKVYE